MENYEERRETNTTRRWRRMVHNPTWHPSIIPSGAREKNKQVLTLLELTTRPSVSMVTADVCSPTS